MGTFVHRAIWTQGHLVTNTFLNFISIVTITLLCVMAGRGSAGPDWARGLRAASGRHRGPPGALPGRGLPAATDGGDARPLHDPRGHQGFLPADQSPPGHVQHQHGQVSHTDTSHYDT